MKLQHSLFNKIIDNIAINSVEENFIQEGRFGNGIFGGGHNRWKKSQRAIQQSGKTLQDTGGLAASVYARTRSTGGFTVSVENNIFKMNVSGGFDVVVGSNKKVGTAPLAAIHHFGGNWKIPVTDRMRAFFWARYKKTKDEKYKFMAISPKTEFTIVMPPRPIFVLQQEDLDIVKRKYSEWIAKSLK